MVAKNNKNCLIGARWLVAAMVFMFLSVSWATEKPGKYWIFFTDKGPKSLQKERLQKAQHSLSNRSLRRRAKVAGTSGQLVDYTDMSVYQPYITELAENGIEPLVVSKWLNAISGYASTKQIQVAQLLPFVKNCRPVAAWIRENPTLSEQPPNNLDKRTDRHTLDYGSSFGQNEMIRVPDVHDLGVHGEGVLIAVFDTGFQLQHQAFSFLNVVAKRDFINNDNDPSYDPNQDSSNQYHHGTSVLSIVGGYAPGNLIGPAFGADFALAKTEDVSSETQVEEDNWIAAAQWADSLGADIITSSVGYMDWYSTDNMDGDTAPITIAADLAVKKGIVVCNSAGNEGSNSWRIIIAPADGDSVIAVGGVNSKGNLWSSSSRGPTADGRTKPDVLAQGTSVYAVIPPVGSDEPDRFGNISGTSASCPQVAGVAALILSVQPDITPMQVREALRQTADHSHKPDNSYGWGIVDALKAVEYWGETPSLPQNFHLYPATPNPFSPSKNARTVISFDLPKDADIHLTVYNLLGQKIRTLWQGPRMAGANQRLSWYGSDDDGILSPSGIYLCRLTINSEAHTIKITLLR